MHFPLKYLQHYINARRRHEGETELVDCWCSFWFVGDSTAFDHFMAALCRLSSLGYQFTSCLSNKDVDLGSPYGTQESDFCIDQPDPSTFFINACPAVQYEMVSTTDSSICPKVRIKVSSPPVVQNMSINFQHDEVGIVLYGWGVHAHSRKEQAEFMRDYFHPFHDILQTNDTLGQYLLMYREHEPQHFNGRGGIYETSFGKIAGRPCNTALSSDEYDDYRNEEALLYLNKTSLSDKVPVVRLFDPLKPIANLHYGNGDCTHYCWSPWRFDVTWHGMTLGIRQFLSMT